MPAFDFDMLQPATTHEWKKRGRKANPLPEKLLQALDESYSHQSTLAMPIKADQFNSFRNVLNKCGIAKNYRIHREIVEDVPAEGYITVYFKVVGRRKADEDA